MPIGIEKLKDPRTRLIAIISGIAIAVMGGTGVTVVTSDSDKQPPGYEKLEERLHKLEIDVTAVKTTVDVIRDDSKYMREKLDQIYIREKD